jgi:hypothetical protein
LSAAEHLVRGGMNVIADKDEDALKTALPLLESMS